MAMRIIHPSFIKIVPLLSEILHGTNRWTDSDLSTVESNTLVRALCPQALLREPLPCEYSPFLHRALHLDLQIISLHFLPPGAHVVEHPEHFKSDYELKDCAITV